MTIVENVTDLHEISTGIFVSIGPILREPQDSKFVNQRVCAKARQMLILKWLLATFFITMSYQQVLLASLVDTGYEKPIETLDELVSSGKPYAAAQNTYFPRLLALDPRASVKKLSERVLWYNFTGQIPKWVQDGYVAEMLLNNFIIYTDSKCYFANSGS